MDTLINPYGGTLVDTGVAPEQAEALKQDAAGFPSLTLNARQSCDLELLMNGGFSPLAGFMTQAQYESVLTRMRLPDGMLWSIPITLDVPPALAEKLQVGGRLALRDAEGFMPAVLAVEDIYRIDRRREAEAVYGTTSTTHPGVAYLMEQTHEVCVGGRLLSVQLPSHADFEALRETPAELRQRFLRMGWRRVVGFHTNRPMHAVHRELTLRAAKVANAHVLLHPVVGLSKPGDLFYFARVHCYQALLKHYPHGLATLSLLPMAVRMAGPREGILNAIVRQNYGCSHMVVGPDHASPPAQDGSRQHFYPSYSAQALLARHQQELSIEMLPMQELLWSPRRRAFATQAELETDGDQGVHFSDAELKNALAHDQPVPDWFSYPDVTAELKRACPPRSRQGFTLFFTGLSGSGKSTLARLLYARFIEAGGRPTTLLDGDVVRQNLSSELGFSKAHRDINIRRIGYVASEITKNGGVAICAPIAPYTATRSAVRAAIEPHGGFIEIHVATPLEVCEGRDRKGLYAKARKGLIPEFTGISDPYETPERPEIRIDTSLLSAREAAEEIYLYLLREGYIDTQPAHGAA